jgi:hypothetical protein
LNVSTQTNPLHVSHGSGIARCKKNMFDQWNSKSSILLIGAIPRLTSLSLTLSVAGEST